MHACVSIRNKLYCNDSEDGTAKQAHSCAHLFVCLFERIGLF